MSDRKYRHRGYMDSGSEEPRARPSAERGRPRLEDGPRGRGLGSPQTVAFKCAVCGTQQPAMLGQLEQDSCCTSCGKPLHTCTNCTYFDPGSRFECRQPISRRLESKTTANACTLFQPKTVRDLSVASPASPADARSAFDALFKKK